MAGTAQILETLIFLFLVRTGVDGDKGYGITFPCEEDIVCFHIWKSSKRIRQNIGIISNGEIQGSQSKEETCTLRIEHPTWENDGYHHCQQRSDGFSTYNTYSSAPELKLLPNRAVSLQCVLLSSLENAHCLNSREKGISLKWVDGDGAEIQDDGQHRITRRSCCDITLTVAFQSPESLEYRCEATVGERNLTSAKLTVRAPVPKGKGRGLIIDLKPENKGRNQDTVGAAVGVAGCVVLSAGVAAFVLNRRRTNNQLPEEPRSDESLTINANTDDVIYADIILPSGSDRVRSHGWESTEYASIR